jgi:hypothetical protein
MLVSAIYPHARDLDELWESDSHIDDIVTSVVRFATRDTGYRDFELSCKGG